jgi:hypothetical protein
MRRRRISRKKDKNKNLRSKIKKERERRFKIRVFDERNICRGVLINSMRRELVQKACSF